MLGDGVVTGRCEFFRRWLLMTPQLCSFSDFWTKG